jgi:predicted XRE-type DNA-binding protein
LVALAFIDNIHNYSFINHINGIKDDNRVENLEWCTSVENLNHALDNNLRIMPNGEKHHKSKLTEVQVLEIRNSHLSQKELTILYNVKQPLISAIINRKKWKHI